MKIYDMHIHTSGEAVNQNYLLEQMEKSGVYGGMLISAYPDIENPAEAGAMPYKERLKLILDWKKNREGRLYSALWIHPFEKNACDIVRDAAESGIDAFKMICDTYPLNCDESMKLIAAVEKTGKPAIFHTGILWSGGVASSINNRPVNWEYMQQFDRLKFDMAHCSWPWYDECIAVYGKFLNSYLTRQSSEMFFDLTPGTPVIYRKDLLTKLFCCGYDTENNIMFGTDSLSNDYDPQWVGGWIARDNAIYEELGLTEKQKEKIYKDNFMRFIKGEDIKHNLPQMNKG